MFNNILKFKETSRSGQSGVSIELFYAKIQKWTFSKNQYPLKVEKKDGIKCGKMLMSLSWMKGTVSPDFSVYLMVC
jgi:hypothetical protein